MAEPIMSTGGDPRDKKQTKFDLNKVDFEWAAKQTDKKELTKAYEALKEDGGFPDLMKAVGERLCQLDPSFRRKIEGNRVSYEEERLVAQDIADFITDIHQMDKRLATNGEEDSKSIFSSATVQPKNEFAEDVERKKLAEHERLKGNEFMQSKDYKDAIDCYTKSITLYPDDPATYSNRALAHLRLKEYARVIEDANEAIKLKPDYIKAYHRRGKAYVAVNKFELAIRDFQYILEKEPNNKDAMNELKQARVKLGGKTATENKSSQPTTNNQKATVNKEAVPNEKKENKFVRVAIQEGSDEEEEENKDQQQQKSSIKIESINTTSDQTPSKNESDKENQPQKSNKIQEVSSKDNESWWKVNENEYDDFKIKETSKKEDAEKIIPKKQETQFKRIQIEEEDEDEKTTTNQVGKEELKKDTKVQENKVDLEVKQKEEEKSKLQDLLKKIDDIKEKASVEYKKGMYDDAIEIFKQAADLAESNLSNFKYFKKDIIEREATIFNNIAACYKQGQHNKKEVEYCTKVIERAPYITDMNILAKAYQRRGYAYEHLEKYAEAKEDMVRVKEIQPSNQQASQALTRLNKALQDMKKVDLSDIEVKIGKIKDEGNEKYKSKKFQEAIAKFSEGVEIYLKDPQLYNQDKDIKLKVTQIYTNRSLSYHQLNNQTKAFEDADYVLKNLDSANPKALFRRAIANKSFGKFEESVRDLQTLFKQDPSKREIKAELDECMKKLVEQQRAQKEKPKQTDAKTPKIQEVASKQVEEVKSTNKVDEVEEEKKVEETPKPKVQSKKMKNLQQEVIDKASELASQKINQNLMKQVPKTAAGLETDYNSLKKDLPSFYNYLKNIPFDVIEKIYKTVEVPAEVFAAIMKVSKEYGIKENVINVAKLIRSLAKASNFDMTLMFMDSKEKNDLKEIMKAIKSSSEVDKELVKELDKIYNL